MAVLARETAFMGRLTRNRRERGLLDLPASSVKSCRSCRGLSLKGYMVALIFARVLFSDTHSCETTILVEVRTGRHSADRGGATGACRHTRCGEACVPPAVRGSTNDSQAHDVCLAETRCQWRRNNDVRPASLAHSKPSAEALPMTT